MITFLSIHAVSRSAAFTVLLICPIWTNKEDSGSNSTGTVVGSSFVGVR